MATRAGSHAGRGFRYQDAVAASLAVEGFVGQSAYGCVVPEGGDDLELKAAGGRTLAQVKSRRDHMGRFHLAQWWALLRRCGMRTGFGLTTNSYWFLKAMLVNAALLSASCKAFLRIRAS